MKHSVFLQLFACCLFLFSANTIYSGAFLRDIKQIQKTAVRPPDITMHSTPIIHEIVEQQYMMHNGEIIDIFDIQQLERINHIIETCSDEYFMQLPSYVRSLPAGKIKQIEVVERFQKAHITKLSTEQFINSLSTYSSFNTWAGCDEKIEAIIQSESPETIYRLARVTSDNTFVKHYPGFFSKFGTEEQIKMQDRLMTIYNKNNGAWGYMRNIFTDPMPAHVKELLAEHASFIQADLQAVRAGREQIASYAYGLPPTELQQEELLELYKRVQRDPIFARRLDEHDIVYEPIESYLAQECSQIIARTGGQLLDQYQQAGNEPTHQLERNIFSLLHEWSNETSYAQHRDAGQHQIYRQLQQCAEEISTRRKALYNRYQSAHALEHNFTAVRFIEQSYNLKPLSLTWVYPTEEQNLINRTLITRLDQLQKSPTLLAEYKSLAKDLSTLVVELNEDNIAQAAQEILECVNENRIKAFMQGVGSEVLSNAQTTAMDVLYGAGTTALEAGFLVACPELAVPYYLGKALYCAYYKAYGIHASVTHIMQETKNAMNAYKEGRFHDMGRHATRTAVNTLQLYLLNKKTTNNCKVNDKTRFNAIEVGARNAKRAKRTDLSGGLPTAGVSVRDRKALGMAKFREFLNNSCFKDKYKRTKKDYSNATVYRATNDISEHITKDDYFYLDNMHCDHIEVFDKHGNAKSVINFDGTLNKEKTDIARNRGRTLDV